MEQLTDKESVVFSVIEYVGNDLECAKLALDFIGDSRVKYQLFTRLYSAAGADSSILERTNLSITKATEMFALFDQGEASSC